MIVPLPRMTKILVANGVNMDLLGIRQPEIYGRQSLADIESILREQVRALATLARLETVELEFFQSNHEGVFLDKLTLGWDGILINPGAWTHSSLALADRLLGLNIPYVEVHLSQLL